MDQEKLKQFLIPIVILVATVGLLVMLAPKIVTNLQSYSSLKQENETKIAQIKEKQNKLERLKKEEAEQERLAKSGEEEKPFYKPIESGMDAEAVIAGEFAEILQLVRANKIKVRTIKYDYNPQDDNFVKGAADKYNVARLNMEMVANYTSYDNFLKELYKHEHFLDIQSIEIVPYKKNKKILLINFKLKLYSAK